MSELPWKTDSARPIFSSFLLSVSCSCLSSPQVAAPQAIMTRRNQKKKNKNKAKPAKASSAAPSAPPSASRESVSLSLRLFKR